MLYWMGSASPGGRGAGGAGPGCAGVEGRHPGRQAWGGRQMLNAEKEEDSNPSLQLDTGQNKGKVHRRQGAQVLQTGGRGGGVGVEVATYLHPPTLFAQQNSPTHRQQGVHVL